MTIYFNKEYVTINSVSIDREQVTIYVEEATNSDGYKLDRLERSELAEEFQSELFKEYYRE